MEPNPKESNDLEPGETIDPEEVRMVFDSVEKKAAEAQDLADQVSGYDCILREAYLIAMKDLTVGKRLSSNGLAVLAFLDIYLW